MNTLHRFTVAQYISLLMCAMTCGCCSSQPRSYSRKVELTDAIGGYVAIADKAAERSLRDWDAHESKIQNTGKIAWPYTVVDYRRVIFVGCNQEFSRAPCGGAWRPVIRVLYHIEHADHYPGITIPLGGMAHFSVVVYMDSNQTEVEGGA